MLEPSIAIICWDFTPPELPGQRRSVCVAHLFPTRNSLKNALGKVDYHINDHNALSGSYCLRQRHHRGAWTSSRSSAQFRTKVHSRAQTRCRPLGLGRPVPLGPTSSAPGYDALPSSDSARTSLTFPYKINTGISQSFAERNSGRPLSQRPLLAVGCLPQLSENCRAR